MECVCDFFLKRYSFEVKDRPTLKSIRFVDMFVTMVTDSVLVTLKGRRNLWIWK